MYPEFVAGDGLEDCETAEELSVPIEALDAVENVLRDVDVAIDADLVGQGSG